MKNKPRSKTKKNGKKRWPVCKVCGHPNCDPLMSSWYSIASLKIERRKRNHQCIACGHSKCKCKNTNRK